MNLSLIFLLLCIFIVYGKVDDNDSEAKIDQVKEHKQSSSKSSKDVSIDQSKIYVELYKQKRRDHMSAVQSIIGIEEQKQRPFVEEILKNIKVILTESRDTLDRVRYEPIKGKLPDTDTVRDTVSKVFENIAFFSDLALRFPSIVRPKLRDVKMKTLIVWAYETTKKAHLIDDHTFNILSLMAQEMDLMPKEEGYINPYGKEKSKEDREREALEEMKKKTLEKQKAKKHDLKIKKGPSMSRSEL